LQCQDTVNHFGCNPLAIQLAATAVKTIFGSDINAFLVQGNTVFSDLWDLLDRQFDRLSALQQPIKGSHCDRQTSPSRASGADAREI
jgi:hypothetical protein